MLDLGTLQAHIKLDGADEFKQDLNTSANAAEEVGSSLKDRLASKAALAKAALIALGVAAAAALAKLTKASVGAYSKTEQLQGGIEKLFGKETAATVEANAQAAFATIGISANEYMQNVTSFSAALLQSLGGDTKKAAKVADMAMQDMADNASIFGSDMQSIQNAYQGFAKQNYTMLDNLKLGYGGTKKEMERLLADAGKLTGKKYDISNLNDVYEAIHAIQKEQGIAGNAAKEASKTIEGSINATKAAWQNLLSGLADPKADLGKIMDGLVDAIGHVLENVMPVVARVFLNIINNLPALFAKLGAKLRELIDKMVEVLPSYSEKLTLAIVNLVLTIIKNLPQIIGFVIDAVGLIINAILNGIGAALGKLIKSGAKIVVAIVSGIRATLGAIWTLIMIIPRKIVALLASAGKALVARGKEFISGLYNGIVSRWNAVRAWIASIPSKIKAALGNLGRLLFGAGKDIMSGLKDGIDAGWENITSSVSKMGEWIKAHKGPKEYDLKLLVPNGNWIMEGLNRGLEEGKQGLKKTLSGIASEISDTQFNATAQLSYAGEGASTTNNNEVYNVYINGAKINDDSQIQTQFKDLLTAMARKGMM